MTMFESFENVDPNCKHRWHQLNYAISAFVEQCELCGGKHWIHTMSD